MVSLDHETFRTQISSLMTDAAHEAKVELLPNDVAFSIRGDYVIANALIAPPENVPIEEADKLFLLYLSFPRDHEISKTIPTGFYVVERMPDQKNPRARIVNVEGKAVLEVPLNVIRSEYPAGQGWEGSYTLTKEPVTHNQAILEQSQAMLYRDIVLQGHGTICYPRAGVWYWIWIVIVATQRLA